MTSVWRADSVSGSTKVIDGDTIVVAGQVVRLHGIDAAELDQTFWWRGQQMACGTMALAALEALTAGVKVRCRVVERDRHGRLVAKVFSPNGVEIGRRLVSAGWALDLPYTRKNLAKWIGDAVPPILGFTAGLATLHRLKATAPEYAVAG